MSKEQDRLARAQREAFRELRLAIEAVGRLMISEGWQMVTEEGEEKADSETILLHVKGEKGNEWARWSFHPTKGRRWVERSDGRESILADHVTRPFSEYEAKMRALSS